MSSHLTAESLFLIGAAVLNLDLYSNTVNHRTS